MEGKFDKVTLEALEQVAEVFGMETLRMLIGRINKEGLVNTRGLIHSLGYDTRNDLSKVVFSMRWAFEEYGRFQDLKKHTYTAQPPIDEIVAWVEKKGLAAFGEDPRPYKNKVKSDARRMNEIAWGFARKTASNPRYRKRTKWFNDVFYRNLSALQEELLLATGDVAIEQMKQSLLNRLKTGPTTRLF